MVSISYCNIFNAIRFIYNPIHFPLRYYLGATEYKIRGHINIIFITIAWARLVRGLGGPHLCLSFMSYLLHLSRHCYDHNPYPSISSWDFYFYDGEFNKQGLTMQSVQCSAEGLIWGHLLPSLLAPDNRIEA